MKKYLILLFSTIFFLSACGKQEDNKSNQEEEKEPAIVEAKINLPEKANIGEKVVTQVTVTQNNKPVTDADEVNFEIWKDGEKDSSEKINATSKKDGTYLIEYTFKENGLYYVQSHVTARSMHTMPKKSIQIGAVAEETEDHEHHGDEDHHHGHSDVSIHLMKPDHVHVNEKTKLTAHIEKSDTPISNAQVKFEITKEGDKKPSWVSVKEAKKGEYIGTFIFPSKGDYSIKIHVENNEGLHEHTVETIAVQ